MSRQKVSRQKWIKHWEIKISLNADIKPPRKINVALVRNSVCVIVLWDNLLFLIEHKGFLNEQERVSKFKIKKTVITCDSE